jgi:hypothetical protein
MHLVQLRHVGIIGGQVKEGYMLSSRIGALACGVALTVSSSAFADSILELPEADAAAPIKWVSLPIPAAQPTGPNVDTPASGNPDLSFKPTPIPLSIVKFTHPVLAAPDDIPPPTPLGPTTVPLPSAMWSGLTLLAGLSLSRYLVLRKPAG